MIYDNDDALDRALAALPLEEPPADLRASILAATIYRPAPMFSRLEIAGLAGILAAIVLLVGFVIGNGGVLFEHSISLVGSQTIRVFSSNATLAWIAAGGGTAIWLSLFTGFQSFSPAKSKVGTAPRR